MTDACVCTKDPVFGRFLVLSLSPALQNVYTWSGEGEPPRCDAYVIDADTMGGDTGAAGLPAPFPAGATVLLCGWGRDLTGEVDALWLERPFRPARLLALLGLGRDGDLPLPSPVKDRRSVRIGPREVRLTGREFAVFCLLYEAGGETVSREEIRRIVWGGRGDPSAVNVYIHRLRLKLSPDGRPIIRGTRGGYALRVPDMPSDGEKENEENERRGKGATLP